ncbi:MAG: SpoIIE family protein phosphatase, partial [Leptospiraceae bacterium]|nr:SpoIIE family protein phosphatase [Leptospiraceae bacterium]
LSILTTQQYRSLLLENTLEVCRNLSYNISRVSREELITDDFYASTRAAIDSLGERQREIRGLNRSYVVNRNGLIVAHTERALMGESVSTEELAAMQSLEDLQESEVRVERRSVLRFVDPIFVRYRNETIWMGATIFEFDRDEIYSPVNRVQNYILILSAVLIGVALALSFLLARRLSRPIEELAEAAARLGSGDFGVQVAVRTSDEIGQLTRVFNEMSVSLRDSETRRLEQAAIKREFEIAQGIQLSLLPANSKDGPYTFHGFMRTAEEVGGDYYDCIQVTHNRKKYWWFVIGDVSGHGLSAGLTMLMAQTAIQTALEIHTGLNTDQIFATLNRVLYSNIRRLHQHRYMTATVYRADSSGNIVYSGLHLEALMYRARKRTVELLPTDGMWLGIEPEIGKELRRQKTRLQKGDLLMLYTDGIVEAMNPQKELYSEKRLIDVLQSAGNRPLEELESKILKSIEDFCEGEEQRDDITFTLIRKN